jgi:hypothetical protein
VLASRNRTLTSCQWKCKVCISFEKPSGSSLKSYTVTIWPQEKQKQHVHTKTYTIVIPQSGNSPNVHQLTSTTKCSIAVQWTIIRQSKGMKCYTCYDMDKSWKHYAKQKKPVARDHMLYDSIYRKCPELEDL